MIRATILTTICSTIFFFTEVDDPIFCPITHLVSLALADKAFEASTLTVPQRVFKHKVWGPVLCTPMLWKREVLKTPIFRQDNLTALSYFQLHGRMNKLGKAAGFMEQLTSYCFRRGTANVVDRKLSHSFRYHKSANTTLLALRPRDRCCP